MAATELFKSILINNTNLKFYGRFESGAETTDSSGNSNTLTAIGTPTYSAGKFGQSVDLASASSQAFSITDGATVKPSGTPYTIGAWFKTSSNSGMIFQSYSLNTNLAGTYVFVDGSGKIAFLSGKNSGTTANVDYKELLSTGTVTSGTWQFVVCTWDSATMRIYLNGSLNNSAAWNNSPVFAATNYVRVGCYNPAGTNSSFFNGSLDDVFLFNGTALSADQIKELYEGRTLGEGWPQSGLVGLWHLNGNSTDFSGNNNHGTDSAITYSLANGKFNQGAGFNGSSSVISVTDSATLKPTNVTVSIWFKTSYSSGDTNIFQSFSQNTNIAGYYIKLGGNSANCQIVLGRNTGTTIGTDWNACTSTKTRNDGNWHQFVATFDGTQMKVYTDGNLDATTNFTGSIGYAATNYIRIGCLNQSGSNSAFFNGTLDELQIYNVAKDANWIRKQYAWARGFYI